MEGHYYIELKFNLRHKSDYKGKAHPWRWWVLKIWLSKVFWVFFVICLLSYARVVHARKNHLEKLPRSPN